MSSTNGHSTASETVRSDRAAGAAESGALPSPTDRRGSANNIGAQLRAHRQASGISLRQFARDLGVSPSFVSQIENNKSQPSVATLYTICTMLNLSIDELFKAQPSETDDTPGTATAVPGPTEPVAAGAASAPATHSFRGALAKLDEASQDRTSPVVSPEQRRRLVLDSGVTWEQLSATHEAAVDFLFVRYDVGGSSVPGDQLTRHAGIEYGYIIRGTLEISLGFETFQVHAGESISFDSATPHRLTNRGDVPVEAVWFVHGRNASHQH